MLDQPITFPQRAIAWLYGLWLNAMTYVFYYFEAVPGVELQAILLVASLPALLQLIMAGGDKRGLAAPVTFIALFFIIIIFSYIGNVESWKSFIYLFNITFAMVVSLIIASHSNRDFIISIANAYSVIGGFLLLMFVLQGNIVSGRLWVGELHPNFLGMIAVSIGVTAFALPNRLLRYGCWSAVMLTLYYSLSRASMLAMFSAFCIVSALSLVKSSYMRIAAYALILCMILIFLLLLTPSTWRTLADFVVYDLLVIDDPSRGIGTGFSGRIQVWLETLQVWLDAPIFGLGYRLHEGHLLNLSSSHNGYLAMLVDTGVFGLLIYLVLIGMSLYGGLRGIDSPEGKKIVIAVIVSYSVYGLFERRALNAGNPYSIWFLIACFYALRAHALWSARYRRDKLESYDNRFDRTAVAVQKDT